VTRDALRTKASSPSEKVTYAKKVRDVSTISQYYDITPKPLRSQAGGKILPHMMQCYVPYKLKGIHTIKPKFVPRVDR